MNPEDIERMKAEHEAALLKAKQETVKGVNMALNTAVLTMLAVALAPATGGSGTPRY